MQGLHRIGFPLIVLMIVVSLPPRVAAAITVIDFEGKTDGTAITTQYSSSGVTFSKATIATAGLTLDEIDYPPVSGSNIVYDDGGPITGVFSQPVLSYGGYFTYSTPITLTAYDQTGKVIGTTTSTFTQNYASSGNPPNQFLSVSNSSGSSSFSIQGDPAGTSYTLDNFTLNASAAPEPGSRATLAIVAVLLASLIWRKRRLAP